LFDHVDGVRYFGQMRNVQSVARACAIMSLVAESSPPPRVPAIAKSLGIPRNTTYELVNTLCAADCLEVGADGTVRLGFRLFELGSAYGQSLDLIREAREAARELVARCNETCHVARLDGREVVYLVKEEGDQFVRMASSVGHRLPAHGTAVGKLLLAYLPRPQLDKLLAGAPLEKMTANTITDVDELIRELDRTLAQGYATDHEESTPAVRCVGAPIRDSSGDVVAAISVSVLATNMGPRREVELARLVTDAADRLSNRLGSPRRLGAAL
jgi:IclR family KDG regulon transcriptional repressor